MRLAGVCTMNRGGRPRRQINTAELLRLRAEGCSFPEIARRLQVGLGTAYRAYQAATNQATPFQNPKATVLRHETNKTREPVPDSDVFDLPPRLKIKLWLLRFRLEREAESKAAKLASSAVCAVDIKHGQAQERD